MTAFRQSNLARSIPEVYRVQGELHHEVAELTMALYPELVAAERP